MFTGWTLASDHRRRHWALHRSAYLDAAEAGDSHPDEGTPPEIDIARLERRLLAIPGVTAIHDRHVWTITSGLDAVSCHLVVSDVAQARKTLLSTQEAMKRFGLTHVTIQVEDQSLRGPRVN